MHDLGLQKTRIHFHPLSQKLRMGAGREASHLAVHYGSYIHLCRRLDFSVCFSQPGVLCGTCTERVKDGKLGLPPAPVTHQRVSVTARSSSLVSHSLKKAAYSLLLGIYLPF